jgi:hypothetical protein
LPSDVATELLQVLADEPDQVVCDLTGLALAGGPMAEVFAPVVYYLTHWSGVRVRLDVPSRLEEVFAAFPESRRLDGDSEPGLPRQRSPRRPVQRWTMSLLPVPISSGEARAASLDVLRDWGMTYLVDAAGVVVSELVTHSVERAHSVIEVSLSRSDTQLRIAVGDCGAGYPGAPAMGGPDILDGHALHLVEAMTRAWGVLPTRNRGKQVWAVLDDLRRPGAGPN